MTATNALSQIEPLMPLIWTRLADIARKAGRATSTVERYAKELKLDVQKRSDMIPRGKFGKAGGAPRLCIPTADAGALLDLLNGVARTGVHGNGGKAKAKGNGKAPAATLKADAPVSNAPIDRLRYHCRALVILCRELDAEITIDKKGAEVARMTTEKVTA